MMKKSIIIGIIVFAVALVAVAFAIGLNMGINKGDTVTTTPTMTNGGTTTTTPPNVPNISPPVEHSWGNWQTVVEPEVGKAGSEMRICSVCQATETREIQVDLTKNWFLNQYDIAKQQYINTLNSNVQNIQSQVNTLHGQASNLYTAYMQEVKQINNRFANLGMSSSGAHQSALQNAQRNYNNSAQVYTNNINALNNQISRIKAEIANPNVDSILTIFTQNCNITSQETYAYYYKYSDSIK